MGAILGLDRIGNLSHAAGIISLSPPAGQLFNVVTIGGQQYRVGVLQRTISSDVTLVSNSLYMIFAVISSGSIQLRVSPNPNSIGPAGFTAWTLLGAFYSNNITPISLGTFVNIEGVPQTEWWITNNQIGPALSAVSAVPSFGAMSHNVYRLRRDGDSVVGEWIMRQTSQGTPGVGIYIIVHPFPILDSHYRSNTTVSTQGLTVGTLRAQEFAPASWRSVNPLYLPANITDGFAASLALVQSGSTLAGDWGPVMPFGGGGQLLSIGIEYKYKVQGWTTTPLRNL